MQFFLFLLTFKAEIFELKFAGWSKMRFWFSSFFSMPKSKIKLRRLPDTFQNILALVLVNFHVKTDRKTKSDNFSARL